MIVLHTLNFIGLFILKLIVVFLLFLNMGLALIFISIMEYLNTTLKFINDIYENQG